VHESNVLEHYDVILASPRFTAWLQFSRGDTLYKTCASAALHNKGFRIRIIKNSKGDCLRLQACASAALHNKGFRIQCKYTVYWVPHASADACKASDAMRTKGSGYRVIMYSLFELS
jgi:hypothetical protein